MKTRSNRLTESLLVLVRGVLECREKIEGKTTGEPCCVWCWRCLREFNLVKIK